MGITIQPRSFEGILPSQYLTVDTSPTQLEQNETTTASPEFTFQLSDVQIKAITEGDYLLIFFGWVLYEDSRNQLHSIPICRMYNRSLLPDLAVCPYTIKVPESKNKEQKPNQNITTGPSVILARMPFLCEHSIETWS